MTFFAGPTIRETPEVSRPTGASDSTVPPLYPGSSLPAKQTQPAASVASWLKNMLPRHRPERGGTFRKRGYWDQAGDTDATVPKSRRRFTDSHRSLASASGGTDHIVRWNTAKDVSQSDSEVLAPPKRAFSAGHQQSSTRLGQKQWTWIPREFQKNMGVHQSDKEDNESSLPPGERHDVPFPEASKSGATDDVVRRLSNAQRLIEAKRKVRRERRSLKESGDYLGVQGINPDTGELDIISPTDSEGSSAGRLQELKLKEVRDKLQHAREGSREVVTGTVHEVERFLHEIESEGVSHASKNAIKTLKAVKWRRHTKQWSSALEPTLSPIAQSRRSTMPAAPKPPQAPESPEVEGSSLPLIDLTPSMETDAQQIRRTVPFIGTGSHERSAGSPGSYGTVVRTPYRQSLANASSATLELLENGVSLSHSQGKGESLRKSPRVEKGRHIAEAQEIYASTPVTFESKETCTSGNGVKHLHSEAPFSEIGSENSAQPPDPPAPNSTVRDKESSVLWPKTQKGSLDPVDLTKDPSTTELSQQGHKRRRLRETLSSMRPVSPMGKGLQANVYPMCKSTRKWMTAQLRGQLNRPTSSQANKGRAPGDEALRSATNLTDLPNNLQTSQLRPALSLDLPSCQIQAANMEKIQPWGADQEWFNSTVQEISKCGQEDRHQLVCTPTTITTALDHLQTKSRQSTVALLSEDRMSAGSAISVETMDAETTRSLGEMTSSSSLRMRSEVHIPSADTTLDRHPQTLGNHAMGLTEHSGAMRKEPSAPTMTGLNTPFTSISILPKTSVNDSVSAIARLAKPAIYPPTGGVKCQDGELGSTLYTRTSLTITPPRKVQGTKRVGLQSAQIKMPGGYPEEVGADVVTADLFRDSLRKLHGTKIPVALFNVVVLLFAVICRLAGIYWKTVQPMADAKSEFWRRHAKHQMTWTDGLRTLLATPCILLAITMFV
ncbi:hypothetical protein NLU13_4759 [Sarocladium strictum]|uniref:Uncharacterized protein n=1 Tax=Sarocladium strictum TaxID=5046 RepID=A0AA39L8H4_SARSR|nr:hypothetical protein NLU13_4759 [Sarocladium strictum]